LKSYNILSFQKFNDFCANLWDFVRTRKSSDIIMKLPVQLFYRCFVNYYSHSIKEVDLLYQHIDVFTVDISMHGLKSGFSNLPYFELSEVGIIY
jgi:hypothetical protein